MAEEVQRVQIKGSDELFRDDRNPRHPVRKGTMTLCHRYTVGKDFTSGNNLRIDIDGAQTILFAIAKSPSNAFLTITETDLETETSDSTRQGKSLTLATATYDVEIFVIFTV